MIGGAVLAALKAGHITFGTEKTRAPNIEKSVFQVLNRDNTQSPAIHF